MSVIGNSIDGGLVALVVVAVVGTVGATFYYQHSVDRLDDRADVLSERAQTLERDLSATRSDLRSVREGTRKLNESLAVAESDVSTLSTRLKRRNRSDATAAELTAKERRLERAGSELADARGDLRAAGDRLEELGGSREPDGIGADEPTGTPADPWADEPWDDVFVEEGDSDPTPTESADATYGDDYGATAACEA